nr:hypothetical protein [uncultured Sphingomonas sp.]
MSARKMKLAGAAAAVVLAAALAGQPARGSDHLDSPAVIADPRADIGDIYAWISPDARKLNLVMAIVGHSFSDRIAYVFHIDSGRRFGTTTSTIDLTCRFAKASEADCRLGRIDRARGDARGQAGIESSGGRFRLFAGLRDDPFFNNVRGTRAAYDLAKKTLAGGARYDASGCPVFSSAQSAAILDQWRHTEGGPASNLLRGWTPSAITVSIDIASINKGGSLLAVWGATVGPREQIDRAARPLTGNALLATLGTDAESDALKIRYNRTAPAKAASFTGDIARGVALYDGFDGHCGDSLLIDPKAPPARRYWPMARLLADDRLWLNSRSGQCTQLFAVERAALNGEAALAGDCGGRSINYDSVNIYRSLITNGTTRGMDDGVHADEKVHSTVDFPFLAAPDGIGPGR